MISLSRLKEMVEEEMENKIKELEEKLLRKEQECENGIKRIKDLEERILNHSNTIEEYCSRLASKEQECERLEKELHKNFEEKDTLHLIIDRLLEASGYDTNTASAEDFEDVYERMRYEQQQLNQLKAENEQLKEELSVIQHNCNREGCKYYDDNTFKVFYECNAQKALQLSANSVTTKYCDLLQTLTEIKEIVFPKNQLIITDSPIFLKILQKISECEGNDGK